MYHDVKILQACVSLMRKYFEAWVQKSKSYLDFVDFVLFVGFFDWIFAVATFFTQEEYYSTHRKMLTTKPKGFTV